MVQQILMNSFCYIIGFAACLSGLYPGNNVLSFTKLIIAFLLGLVVIIGSILYFTA